MYSTLHLEQTMYDDMMIEEQSRICGCCCHAARIISSFTLCLLQERGHILGERECLPQPTNCKVLLA